MCVDCVLCSSFAFLQPPLRLEKMEEDDSFYSSQGIVHPNCTGQNSNDEPLSFSVISDNVPNSVHFALLLPSEGRFILTFSQRHTSGLVLCFPSVANAALAS